MQFRTSEQGFGITDRRTAFTTACLGAFLVLAGIAIAVAGVIRAGEASGSVVIETVIFGIAATAFGAFLCRAGLRAARRLRTASPVVNTRAQDDDQLDKAA